MPQPQTFTPLTDRYRRTQVKSGDTGRSHDTGTLADGSTFDSSAGRAPLEFVMGSGQIIPGMAVGDKKVVEAPCDRAYDAADPRTREAVSAPRSRRISR